MRRTTLFYKIRVFLCLFLCLPSWVEGAEPKPGILTITRAFEREGEGVLLFDALDADGIPLSLADSELTLTLGENAAAIRSPQTLREAEESIATALVLDTSHPMGTNDRARMKKAVSSWIEATRPGDKLAIITCGGVPQMRADFVSDHALLTAVADTLKFGEEGESHLYDALRMAADLFARKADAVPPMPARLSVVIFSDGLDKGSLQTTREEALSLLAAQSAQIYVAAPGDALEAAQSLSPSGNVLPAGEGHLSYDKALAALHDRILDSYMLRFALEDRPTDGFVYVARLAARDALGNLVAQGGSVLRVPQDSAEIAAPIDVADIRKPPVETVGALVEGEPTPPPIIALIQTIPPAEIPTPEASSPNGPSSQRQTPGGQPASQRRPSYLDLLSGNQQLLAIVFSIMFLGIITFFTIQSHKTTKKQRPLEAMKEPKRPEQPDRPSASHDSPTMQTNVVVKPPEYRPVSAEPYTHLRQQALNADGEPQGIRVMFRIIGPTGAVENKTLSVADGFSIGRDISCNLYVKDPIMTKKRLVLAISQERTLMLKGIKMSGILINGHKVRGDYPLDSGDTLRIGRISILVQYAQEAGG